jgi:hypothetical protein
MNIRHDAFNGVIQCPHRLMGALRKDPKMLSPADRGENRNYDPESFVNPSLCIIYTPNLLNLTKDSLFLRLLVTAFCNHFVTHLLEPA